MYACIHTCTRWGALASTDRLYDMVNHAWVNVTHNWMNFIYIYIYKCVKVKLKQLTYTSAIKCCFNVNLINLIKTAALFYCSRSTLENKENCETSDLCRKETSPIGQQWVLIDNAILERNTQWSHPENEIHHLLSPFFCFGTTHRVAKLHQLLH